VAAARRGVTGSTDVFTVEKRSAVMARIRGRGNRDTELRFLAILRRCRITGWRRNWPLFGRPDFVFPQARVAVFIDGCFWHVCPRHYNAPAQNAEFWRRKRDVNRRRDRLVTRTLQARGWLVLRIWEHALSETDARILWRLRRALARDGE
jgi:DNA mismatch endonuclease (patch repair protein)